MTHYVTCHRQLMQCESLFDHLVGAELNAIDRSTPIALTILRLMTNALARGSTAWQIGDRS